MAYKPTQNTVGEFRESDVRNWFTYTVTKDSWAIQNGFTHEIDVLDGVRYAIVKKTVAYICVDEAADGSPITEKWNIEKHNVFVR
jgi:hypothetical protein